MARNEEQEDTKEFLPPLEFGSLVLPFFMQALIKLGVAEDPVAGTPSENLALGKRLIDLLDLLRDRTKGNLDEDEDKFLEAALSRLKLAYIERMKLIKT